MNGTAHSRQYCLVNDIYSYRLYIEESNSKCHECVEVKIKSNHGQHQQFSCIENKQTAIAIANVIVNIF